LKKLMLLAAMLVMTMAITVPALAQTGSEVSTFSDDGATLLSLGVGILLIASGLLVRRVFGKF
jgi:hypothetical protein